MPSPVSTWRALHQQRVASLTQVHQPGEVMQSDGPGVAGATKVLMQSGGSTSLALRLSWL